MPAAGPGKRFGQEKNKPFFPLMGTPLIVWAARALEAVPEITEIIPIVNKPYMEKAIGIFEEYGLKKIKQIAAGGAERHDSVQSGLKLVGNKASAVLIHDGARPLIEPSAIKAAIDELYANEELDGVAVGVPVKDTIKNVDDSLTITATPERKALWAAQTPQIFRLDALVRAYENASRDGYSSTDDSAVVEYSGGKVRMIMGSYRNIKITSPEDIALAESYLKAAL